MLARCLSASLQGLEARPVVVEVDLAPGLPGVQLVGLPDKAIQESRERVRSGLRNSGFRCQLLRVARTIADLQRPDQRRSKRRGRSELLPLHRSAQATWSSVVAGTLVRCVPVGLGADRRGLEMAVIEGTQRMGHRFTEPLEPLNNRCFHHVLLGLSSV